ncbi:hypothetical protein [Ruixingdingia sedimenti]|uniref:Uncharacterized protein n=1 Tax=Ruixingdingia sedimenti TaxID=3073604 RepID=A0ABU1F5Y3_9RHOB|nr:hypothetical protein [Xinfangfangia sp. LG-4]MDR5651842.1 hypothetical protein [Xinfangfangia sp. LG-4]
MSGIEFEAVPFPKEHFDADWQVQIGVHIRLAGITIEKTKDELRAAFEAEPDAMTALVENLADWSDKLQAYHKMLDAAMARLMVVGCEVGGIPLDDEEGA